MHIETHAKETVQKMHELNMAVAAFEIRHNMGKLETIKPEDVEALIAAHKALAKHLFDYSD